MHRINVCAAPESATMAAWRIAASLQNGYFVRAEID